MKTIAFTIALGIVLFHPHAVVGGEIDVIEWRYARDDKKSVEFVLNDEVIGRGSDGADALDTLLQLKDRKSLRSIVLYQPELGRTIPANPRTVERFEAYRKEKRVYAFARPSGEFSIVFVDREKTPTALEMDGKPAKTADVKGRVIELSKKRGQLIVIENVGNGTVDYDEWEELVDRLHKSGDLLRIWRN